MKNDLFGARIAPDCEYCEKYSKDSGACKLGRTIKNGKCRKFDYDPTLRTPKGEARPMQFSREDFEI